MYCKVTECVANNSEGKKILKFIFNTTEEHLEENTLFKENDAERQSVGNKDNVSNMSSITVFLTDFFRVCKTVDGTLQTRSVCSLSIMIF